MTAQIQRILFEEGERRRGDEGEMGRWEEGEKINDASRTCHSQHEVLP